MRGLWLLPILVVFAALYFSSYQGHGMLGFDAAQYAAIGRSVARGEGYRNFDGTAETFRPPVLPLSIALALRVAGRETDAVARIPVILFALGCIAVVYAFLLSDGGIPAALAGAVSLAIFPSFWTATAKLLTELPFMLFYTVAVVAFHRGLYRNPRWFWVAWTGWALSLLTRYTALLYGPTVALFCMLAALTRQREALRRMWSREFLLGPLLALLIIAPWFLHVWVHSGHPLSGIYRASGQIPTYNHGSMPPWYYMAILPDMLGWLPTLALGLALPALVVTRSDLGIRCALAAAVIVAWMSRYDWKNDRLVSAALPFCAILIGLGVHMILGRRTSRTTPTGSLPAGGRSQWHLVASLVVGVWLTAAFVLNYRATRKPLRVQRPGYPSFLRAMDELRRIAPPDAVLLSTTGRETRWYADRRCMPFRSKTPDGKQRTFLQSLHESDWVVINNWHSPQALFSEKLLSLLAQGDFESHDARLYSHRRNKQLFWTAIVRSETLLQRYRAAGLPGPVE